MSIINKYLSIVHEQLNEIEANEIGSIEMAADLLAETLQRDGLIYVFGSGHSQMFSLEMFYRAGGLVPVHPMLEASLSMYTGTITSEYERLPKIGTVIFEKSGMSANDVLIIVSHSGRNTLPVDLALSAKESGIKVITIASNKFQEGVMSRHDSGKFVSDFADIVIDNHCEYGDAVIDIGGMPSKVAGTSSILSISILESLVAQTVQACINVGFVPPVWMSGNVEEGDAKNKKHYENFKNRIRYL